MELEINHLYFSNYYGRCYIIDFETCFLNGFSMDCVMFKNEDNSVPCVVDKKTFMTRFEPIMEYRFTNNKTISNEYYENYEEFLLKNKNTKKFYQLIDTARHKIFEEKIVINNDKEINDKLDKIKKHINGIGKKIKDIQKFDLEKDTLQKSINLLIEKTIKEAFN